MSILRQVMHACLLVVAPWRLAPAATVVPTAIAAPIGLLAISLCFGMVVAGLYVGGGEPFRSMREYYQVLAWASVLFGGVLFGVLASLSLVALAFVGAARWLIGPGLQAGPGGTSRSETRVILLAPVCGVFPVAVWAVLAATAYASSPDFGIVGPSGKPAWVSSRLFAVVGSPCWLPFLLLGGLTLVALETGRAARLEVISRQGDLCQRCGYSLAGLPRDCDCPECGATPSPAAAARSSEGASGTPPAPSAHPPR